MSNIWWTLLLLIGLPLLSESLASNQFSWFKWDGLDGTEWLTTFNGTVEDVPDEIDYREMGYVTSVDDQGDNCSASWAFALTGAIEALAVGTNCDPFKLSAQQLIDCSDDKNDCQKGYLKTAMQYAIANGLQYARDYQLVGEKQDCKYKSDKVAFRFEGVNAIPHMNESQLKFTVGTVGPVVTGIYKAEAFDAFKGDGIFSTDETPHEWVKPNHYVLIVGYGSSVQSANGTVKEDYWILKNSFGRQWGDEGYMKFRRNIGLNVIGNRVIWPTQGKTD